MLVIFSYKKHFSFPAIKKVSINCEIYCNRRLSNKIFCPLIVKEIISID